MEATTPTHPYYPTHILLPGYQHPALDFDLIYGIFFAAALVVVVGMWSASGKIERLSTIERAICCWLIVSGLIHLLIEGYYVITMDLYKHSPGIYLSDGWKEYSKADSRYATRDSFIVSMEAITAFAWGPLCPVAVYGMFTGKPWRYLLMVIISVGQIYGDIMYYGTCYLEGFQHSRPEPLYFWCYFVLLNAIWIVVPGMVLSYGAGKITAAVGKADKGASNIKKKN